MENLLASSQAREDFCAHPRRRRFARPVAGAGAGDRRGLRRLQLLSRQLPGPRGGDDPYRPVQGRRTTATTSRCCCRTRSAMGRCARRCRSPAGSWTARWRPLRAACGSTRWPCVASTCWSAKDLPYTMATGEVLADITPRETLEAALAAIDYRGVPRTPAGRRARRASISGWASAAWSSPPPTGRAFYKAAGIPGSGHEAAWVRIEPSGAVNASCGLRATGQGYENVARATRWPRGLASTRPVCELHLGHTDIAPYGMGSRGARGGTAGGGDALPVRAWMRGPRCWRSRRSALGLARERRPAHA